MSQGTLSMLIKLLARCPALLTKPEDESSLVPNGKCQHLVEEPEDCCTWLLEKVLKLRACCLSYAALQI